jgi:hypothetical protein
MADVKPATPEEVEEFRNAVANLLSFGRRCIVITDEGRQRLLALLDAERRARETTEDILAAIEAGLTNEFGGPEKWEGHDVVSGMEAFLRHHKEKESSLDRERQRAEAAERKVAELEQWRPIGTAPKDTRLLFVTETGSVFVGEWSGKPHTVKVIGWLPLPSPPAEDTR